MMTCLTDSNGEATAIFETVELQAPTFYALCLLMWANRFSEEDVPMCS
jgi:hypothetical protein